MCATSLTPVQKRCVLLMDQYQSPLIREGIGGRWGVEGSPTRSVVFLEWFDASFGVNTIRSLIAKRVVDVYEETPSNFKLGLSEWGEPYGPIKAQPRTVAV